MSVTMFYSGWQPLLHTLVVGTLAYAWVVVLLRVSGKRTLSKWNAFDFVVTIAFGSVLAGALTSQSTSMAQIAVALGVLVAWQFLITWLSVRVEAVRRGVKGEPTLLLFRGDFQDEALRRQRVTRGEVLAALRNNGSGAIEDVEAVVLETDGSFSVVERQNAGSGSAFDGVQGYPSQDA